MRGQQRQALEQSSATGRRARRRSTARRRSCGSVATRDGALGERLGAQEARRGACGDAPSAEKKTKRSTPARSAACTIRHVATPLSSSIEPAGWSRIAAREVHDGAHAAQRVAEGGRVGEVAERDLHAHALGPEPARIAHEAAHRLARGGEAPQQRRADEAGRTGEQEHAGQR